MTSIFHDLMIRFIIHVKDYYYLYILLKFNIIISMADYIDIIVQTTNIPNYAKRTYSDYKALTFTMLAVQSPLKPAFY